MNNVNVNKDDNIYLVKNFIKDLSFENLQSVNENKFYDNNNSKLKVSMNVFYKPYNDNFFSLLLRYTLYCSSEQNKQTLFNLELDYQGFFKVLKEDHNKEELTKNGVKLLFPFVKAIVEDLTRKGGNIPITLNELDFNLIKN